MLLSLAEISSLGCHLTRLVRSRVFDVSNALARNANALKSRVSGYKDVNATPGR